MEGTSGTLRRRRVSQATEARNWDDLLADNGLVQLEAGSRAPGQGNQCFFHPSLIPAAMKCLAGWLAG